MTGPSAVHFHPQADHAGYTASLKQSMGSKLFFVNHIPVDIIGCFMDFGCADGELLRVLSKLCPYAKMVGVDNSLEMQKACAKNFPEVFLQAELSHPDKFPSTLILSSVIHEVLSLPGADFAGWWAAIERLGFDYIAIRDFSVPAWCRDTRTPLDWIRPAMEEDSTRVWDFEEKWGEVGSLYNFMHYLIKRPYKGNWRREMQENYVALDTQQLRLAVTRTGHYAIKHLQLTRTSSFALGTMQDLGFCPDISTHAEVVLVRQGKQRAIALPVREQDLEPTLATGGVAT